jgi:hypothetical protein
MAWTETNWRYNNCNGLPTTMLLTDVMVGDVRIEEDTKGVGHVMCHLLTVTFVSGSQECSYEERKGGLSICWHRNK